MTFERAAIFVKRTEDNGKGYPHRRVRRPITRPSDCHTIDWEEGGGYCTEKDEEVGHGDVVAIKLVVKVVVRGGIRDALMPRRCE